jgi:hypothetical protein
LVGGGSHAAVIPTADQDNHQFGMLANSSRRRRFQELQPSVPISASLLDSSSNLFQCLPFPSQYLIVVERTRRKEGRQGGASASPGRLVSQMTTKKKGKRRSTDHSKYWILEEGRKLGRDKERQHARRYRCWKLDQTNVPLGPRPCPYSPYRLLTVAQT